MEEKNIFQAHKVHFEFIAREANNENLPFSLIFIHAEDQLLSTESIELMCIENINLYERIAKHYTNDS